MEGCNQHSLYSAVTSMESALSRVRYFVSR